MSSGDGSRSRGDDAVDPLRPVSVALVNDHELVVRGLQRMLEDYADRVRVVELAVDTSVGRPVDVALYDTFSASQASADDIDVLLGDPRVSAVVVYSWSMQPELVEHALRKGVRGYLSKSLQGPDLVAALEKVVAGSAVVLPRDDLGRDHVGSGGDWPGRAEGLSVRQAEVVSLITQGLSNTEIAEVTYLSPNTVKSYIREAYRTMGVTSRTQAVLWGIDHGMVPTRQRIHPEPEGERPG